MIPKGVRGNRRSRLQVLEIKEKIRPLLISENQNSVEQILDVVKIPKRTYFRYKSVIWKEEQESMLKKRRDVIKQNALENRDSLVEMSSTNYRRQR